MLKKHVLELCSKEIKERLGSLDDLPYELANTVANVYYRFFDLYTDLEETEEKKAENPDHWMSTSLIGKLGKNLDLFKAMGKFEEECIDIQSHYESIIEMIDNLRRIDRERQPYVYQLAVEFYLDWFKYRIKHLTKKPHFIRAIEKKMKRRKINEIPNLIDLLDV